MLTLRCCVADRERGGMAAALLRIAYDHLIDLLGHVVFWEGVGVSNHLHLIGHVKRVLQLQNGITL
jgi:hypothetical protein